MRIKMGKDQLLRINRGTKFDNTVGALPPAASYVFSLRNGKVVAVSFPQK
jgi:hypothetical protein